jgi:hypothetical protein
LAFAEAVDDLEPQLVVRALQMMMREPDRKWPPKAGEVRGLIQPRHDHEGVAVRIATRITEIMRLKGYTNHVAAYEALDAFHPMARRVTKAFGGFVALCKDTPVDGIATLRAQMRNWMISQFRREEAHALQLALHAPRGAQLPQATHAHIDAHHAYALDAHDSDAAWPRAADADGSGVCVEGNDAYRHAHAAL